MTKPPEEIKKVIEKTLDEMGIEHKDGTVIGTEGNKSLFHILLPKLEIMIYMLEKHTYRSLIQAELILAKDLVESLASKTAKEQGEFIVKLQDLLLTYNVRCEFIYKENKLTSVRVYKMIHNNEMNYQNVMHNIFRISEIIPNLVNHIKKEIGITIDKVESSPETTPGIG